MTEARPTPEQAVEAVRKAFPFQTYMRRDPAPMLTVAETVARYLSPGARLFDLGSGPCDKTAVAAQLGVDCTAVDDLQDAWHLEGDNVEKILAFAAEAGIDFHRQMPPMEPEAYDMVMMNDVIEHLVDSPRELMIDLVTRLKPGGVLFLTVPNLANIRKRLDLMRGRTNLPNFDLYYWYQGPWRGPKREYVRGDLEALVRHLSLDLVELRTVDHMLAKLPPRLHGLYRLVTKVFPDWRDSWLLIARKPEGWMPRHSVDAAEFARIYNSTNLSRMHDGTEG